MLVSISRAPAESFAADSIDDSGADGIVDATEKGGEGLWAGSQMALVTGFQTNVNSRIVFAGGIGLFSDEYARKELPSGTPSGNSQLARDIAAWIFLETLTLHIDSVELHRVNQTVAPEMYTTDDQIVIPRISLHTTAGPRYGSLTAASVTCSWSLRCSIPTSV
ncbi:hypothetical protein M405DRAFT_880201, partial [Rhizopogon salebrosus TDB-379]